MKTVGIIAEYNPFHKGHAYHIEETRSITGADCVVIIMSGNFVQRGTPAIADKFTRAQTALLGGADLVIELPTVYATASAEFFAHGAISILNSIGKIDYLSFGSETDDINKLDKIAQILHSEPQEYKDMLKDGLKSGLSMPVARKNALNALFPDTMNISEIIDTPNNILGIEYLKALHHFNSDIRPIIVKRTGNGYHDTDLNEGFASATALRNSFEQDTFKNIKNYMPDKIYDLYCQNYGQILPINTDDMNMLLYYSLMLNKTCLENFMDINSNLANKILNTLKKGDFPDHDSLILSLKSKELTHTRISRGILHVLLNIKKTDFRIIKEQNYPVYGRILGFSDTGRQFLKNIRKETSLKLITKLSEYSDNSKTAIGMLLEKDIFASNVYRNIVKNKYGVVMKDDFRRVPEKSHLD